MAEASISVDQDQFICPVCLDLLKDPVTLPCGHSFCKVCINDCRDQKGVHSCPQCRDTFTPRPVLRRNTMLAEVMEKLKKTEVQAASPAHCYAGPGDVECDCCTGRKRKAIKSCPMCVASLCEIHLKSHLEIPVLKKHTLIEISAKPQEKICSEHDEVLNIYCRTDEICICSLCMLDKHKGHNAVSVAAGRAEKQSKIKEEQMKSQQRIQEKQKKVQELKQAVNTIKLSAQTAVEDSEIIFTELISYMEKKRSEVMELIRAQEKSQLSRAERLLEKLEQDIADLQRRVTELEQLSHTQDHLHFLQSFQSLCVSSERDYSSSITVHQHLSFNGVRNSLSGLKKKFEEFCEEKFSKIPPQVEDVQILPSEPKGREDYLKCEFNIWAITPEEREEHDKQFDLFTHTLGYVSGVQVRKYFLQSGLPASIMDKIWELADMGKDGKMDRLEFSIAMKLIKLKLQGHPLPMSLPIIMKQTSVPVMKSSERFVEDVQILPSEPKGREDYLKCEFNIWAITPEEREEHDKQFDLFTHTLGYVSGVQVRKYFLQSGLPASIMDKIWELADMGKDGKLDRLEFSIAMKLIMLKLQGHPLPISLPIIMKQTPVPVMKRFGEFNIWAITPEEREEHDKQFDLFTHTLGYVSGVQVRKYFLQSGLPASIMDKIWELADMGKDGKLDRLEFSIAMKLIMLKLQGHPLPISLPIIMKQTPVPVMKRFGEFNIWAITPEEREEHDKQFDSFTHTLGYVSGVQVRKYFLQSGLPASIMDKIWELADMGKDGKLDRLEFSIAMKLIKLKLQGHPLPMSLPIIMKQTSVPVMKSSERFGKLSVN